METASRNRINILVINKKDSHLLVDFYDQYFLEIAMQENLVWVKNIPDELILTAAIQRIPSQRIYATEQGLLYPIGKLMPVGSLPDLFWQPIQKGLVVELPPINPNYFGVDAHIPIKLVSRATPENALFLLVNLADLGSYLKTAAAWRMESLQWTIIGQYHALLKGTPMATLRGTPYWRRGTHILPLGLDLEWSILAQATARHLDPDEQHWIFWQKNGQYGLVPKINFKALSRSSFSYTKEHLSSSNLP
ncbi:MAG: hypothetical protein ACRBFS_23840 [Aureispira sp.]